MHHVVLHFHNRLLFFGFWPRTGSWSPHLSYTDPSSSPYPAYLQMLHHLTSICKPLAYRSPYQPWNRAWSPDHTSFDCIIFNRGRFSRSPSNSCSRTPQFFYLLLLPWQIAVSLPLYYTLTVKLTIECFSTQIARLRLYLFWNRLPLDHLLSCTLAILLHQNPLNLFLSHSTDSWCVPIIYALVMYSNVPYGL